ncbi:MAG: hypothetical protein AABX12_05105 [Nanoarchaeota archaeon]
MSHAENKLNWCLNKAGREIRETRYHRGLRKISPDKQQALRHVTKAEHFLKATAYVKNHTECGICHATRL